MQKKMTVCRYCSKSKPKFNF